MTADSDGNLYVAGVTRSADFKTTAGAFQTKSNAGSDCGSTTPCSAGFDAKLNPSGSDLLFSTFLPAVPSGIAVTRRRHIRESRYLDSVIPL
jgi:hypothetical protein